jgi:hypothetical protein
MQWHNPKGLCDIMIGFFDGTLKGEFKPKPRLEFTQRTYE